MLLLAVCLVSELGFVSDEEQDWLHMTRTNGFGGGGGGGGENGELGGGGEGQSQERP